MLRAYEGLGRAIYHFCWDYVECNDALDEEACERLKRRIFRRIVCKILVSVFTALCMAVNRCWDHCVFIG